MAASLLPIPRAVFYNASTGEALAGGFVYTYVPGGVTPKTTWQDAGETTPNANPITLDASGSCLLYGSGAYQITVTDALGNQIPGYSGLSADASSAAGISAAMVPVVAAATTTDATGLLTFEAIGGSAVTRSVLNKLRDIVTVGDFGAVGDATTDDTAAIQAAINECSATGSILLLQGSGGANFKITSQLSITTASGLRIIGSSPSINRLTASGNFGSILNFFGSAAGIDIDNVGFVQSDTTTPCVSYSQGAQVIKFSDCAFSGDLTGSLIYSQAAGYIEYWGCIWNCNGANTNGIVLDGFNQNTVFMGGHAGGPGQWLIIENTGGNIANNVQGTKATAFTSICTGTTAIQIGDAAFSTQFIGCIIDQAQSRCIVIGGGASLTQLIGGYYGLQGGGGGGICILLASNCGPGTTINGVQTFGGDNSISIQASGSSRVGGVSITNNVFNAATVDTIGLDSVNGCIVTGNIDLSTPSNGSWATSATFGNGAYTFGNNDWYTTGPAAFHAPSSYHATPDRGITLANKGVSASVSGTSLVVAHGLTSVAPNVVRITQLGGAGMNYNVSSISGSTFTISYGTSGAATFMWEAEYYS